MSNVSDKSFIYRSYPKLAYGSINIQYQIESPLVLFLILEISAR